MTTLQAIQRLIHEGARNGRELVKASWAVRESGSEANDLAMVAIRNGLDSIPRNEALRNEMAAVWPELGDVARAKLPRGRPRRPVVQVHPSAEKLQHWSEIARSHSLPLARLLEMAMDEWTGASAMLNDHGMKS